MDQDFVTGVFQRYRVMGPSGMHLGQYSVQIPSGEVIEFDGVNVKFGGQSFISPATRGAVRAGWLVLVDETARSSVHVPAASSPSARTMPLVRVSEEERVVGTVDAANQRRVEAAEASQAMAVDSLRAPAPVPAPPAPVPAPPAPGRLPPPRSVEPTPVVTEASINGATRIVARVKRSEGVESGSTTLEGTEDEVQIVGRVASGTTFDGKFSDARSVTEAVRQLESRGPAKVAHVAPEAPPPEAPFVTPPEAPSVTPSPAGGQGGENLEDLFPDVASSGVPHTPVLSSSAPLESWDRTGPWRDRVKRAFDMYGDDRHMLEQIAQVESQNVASQIRSEMSRRFR